MAFKNLLAEWKSGWTILSAFVAFVITIIGYFVASPPTLWREAGDQPIFVSFLVTVAVALVACSVMAGTRPTIQVTFKFFAPVAFVAIVAYFLLRAQFSCPFSDARMSIGWIYLPESAEYVAKNPGQSCGLLIADFIGDTDKIWPRSQIFLTWVLVLLVYVAAVTSLTMTLVRLMNHVRGD